MATILTRAVALSEVDGRRQIRIDPDRWHVELGVQTAGMSLSDAKGVLTPAVKPTDAQVAVLQSLPELGAIEASKYRSVVMRASFLGQERSDISEAVKDGSTFATLRCCTVFLVMRTVHSIHQ